MLRIFLSRVGKKGKRHSKALPAHRISCVCYIMSSVLCYIAWGSAGVFYSKKRLAIMRTGGKVWTHLFDIFGLQSGFLREWQMGVDKVGWIIILILNQDEIR